MKWITFGASEKWRAEKYTNWLNEHNIHTGEVFIIDNIWQVHYMPIDKEQKELCEKQFEYWLYNEMM